MINNNPNKSSSINNNFISGSTYYNSTILVGSSGQIIDANSNINVIPTSIISGSTPIWGTATTFMTSDSAPLLSQTGVTPGQYFYPTINVDSNGRITKATSIFAPPQQTIGSTFKFSYKDTIFLSSDSAPALENIGIFGKNNFITQNYINPQITVDATGRITTVNPALGLQSAGAGATLFLNYKVNNVSYQGNKYPTYYIPSDSTFALSSTGVTPGTYNYPRITVDVTGRITGASSLATTTLGYTPTSFVGATPKLGSLNVFMTSDSTPALEQISGLTPGIYSYPTITVDSTGRITGASSLIIPNTVGYTPTSFIGATVNTGSCALYMPSDSAPALQQTGVTPGIYSYSRITVDATGRITGASNLSAPALAGFTPTSFVGATAKIGTATTYMTIDSAPALEQISGLTPGIYSYSRITVDTTGRITGASSLLKPLQLGYTPTSTIGATVKIGSMNVYMTSDSAPALEQIFGLTPGIYTYPNLQVDATGRIISVSSNILSQSSYPTSVISNSLITGTSKTFMTSDSAPALKVMNGLMAGYYQNIKSINVNSSGLITNINLVDFSSQSLINITNPWLCSYLTNNNNWDYIYPINSNNIFNTNNNNNNIISNTNFTTTNPYNISDVYQYYNNQNNLIGNLFTVDTVTGEITYNGATQITISINVNALLNIQIPAFTYFISNNLKYYNYLALNDSNFKQIKNLQLGLFINNILITSQSQNITYQLNNIYYNYDLISTVKINSGDKISIKQLNTFDMSINGTGVNIQDKSKLSTGLGFLNFLTFNFNLSLIDNLKGSLYFNPSITSSNILNINWNINQNNAMFNVSNNTNNLNNTKYLFSTNTNSYVQLIDISNGVFQNVSSFPITFNFSYSIDLSLLIKQTITIEVGQKFYNYYNINVTNLNFTTNLYKIDSNNNITIIPNSTVSNSSITSQQTNTFNINSCIITLNSNDTIYLGYSSNFNNNINSQINNQTSYNTKKIVTLGQLIIDNYMSYFINISNFSFSFNSVNNFYVSFSDYNYMLLTNKNSNLPISFNINSNSPISFNINSNMYNSGSSIPYNFMLNNVNINFPNSNFIFDKTNNIIKYTGLTKINTNISYTIDIQILLSQTISASYLEASSIIKSITYYSSELLTFQVVLVIQNSITNKISAILTNNSYSQNINSYTPSNTSFYTFNFNNPNIVVLSPNDTIFLTYYIPNLFSNLSIRNNFYKNNYNYNLPIVKSQLQNWVGGNSKWTMTTSTSTNYNINYNNFNLQILN